MKLKIYNDTNLLRKVSADNQIYISLLLKYIMQYKINYIYI